MAALKNDTTQIARPRWRRAIVASSVVGSLVLGGIVMLPTVLNQTEYRNRVLNTAFSKYGLKGTSATASGGWLVPMSYQQIEITDADGRVKVTVDEVRTSKSLLSLASSGNDLGTITLVNPVVEIALDEDGRLPIAQPDAIPSAVNVKFDVEGGAFKLSVPWRELPIVDVDGLNIAGAIEQREDGRWLRVDPVRVFDHEPLSEAQTEQNLALIAPVLSQTTRVTGEASVWLDGVDMRLDGDPDADPDGSQAAVSPFPLSGRAEFYHVEARLKPEWATQIGQMLGQLGNRPVPDRLEIVRDSVVDFQFTEQGIHHEGLAIVLPDVANRLRVHSSGLVGLDESLNLNLAVQMPAPRGVGGPLLNTLTRLVATPLQLRVVGTVSEPKQVPPAGGTWLDEASQRIAPDRHSPEPPPVAQAVMELIQTGADPNKHRAENDLPGSILGLIRAVKHEKERKQREVEPPPTE